VNYLSNAIKYGGQPPQVFISSHLQSDGLVQYRVEDNGAGIKPEQRQQVFQKFERLGRRTIEGHGLGLSIVKTVVEKLSGQVGIEDRPDGQSGSCFTFTLPAIPQQDSVSLAEGRSPA
jgi:two-component system, sensor histidine kinase and response regulator